MAVVDVTEDYNGLSADDQVEFDGKESGVATRWFDVTFDTADVAADRPMLAKADASVPQLGDAHPYSTNHPTTSATWMYAMSRRVTVNVKSPLVFRVIVQYASMLNPLLEPAIKEWLTASTTEPIDTDITGAIDLTNSADEPFDPPPTEEFDDLVLRGTYNVPVFFPIQMALYKGAVNADPFLGFAPGQAKVMVYTAREVKAITGSAYVEITVEIQFRYDGWRRRFLDQGYRTKDGTDASGKPKYLPIKDEEGNKVDEPVLLNGIGQKLGETDPIVRLAFWTLRQEVFTGEFARLL